MSPFVTRRRVVVLSQLIVASPALDLFRCELVFDAMRTRRHDTLRQAPFRAAG